MKILEVDRINNKVKVEPLIEAVEAGDYIGSVDGTPIGGVYADEDANVGEIWVKVFFVKEVQTILNSKNASSTYLPNSSL